MNDEDCSNNLENSKEEERETDIRSKNSALVDAERNKKSKKDPECDMNDMGMCALDHIIKSCIGSNITRT